MAGPAPVQAGAAGKQVLCGHCGGGWYVWRKVVLSSGTASFFGVEAFSPEATVLSCMTCGQLQFFEMGRVELYAQQEQQQQEQQQEQQG